MAHCLVWYLPTQRLEIVPINYILYHEIRRVKKDELRKVYFNSNKMAPMPSLPILESFYHTEAKELVNGRVYPAFIKQIFGESFLSYF